MSAEARRKEISAEQAGLESLGAELRNLCDRMTAAYADASIRLRRSSAASADREKELQAQLAAAQRELEAARAANIELKDKLQKMTSAYQTLKGRVDTAGAERNIPALCPRCGRKAEVGAVFCGNCGMRLVP